MIYLLTALTAYLIIGVILYICVQLGFFELDIQSKSTGEFLDKHTIKYKVLKFAFCIGWIFLAYQVFTRGDTDE